jgi:hypothetical protein
LLKTDASYALKASKAYQDIVNMLNEAWQAAQNASKAANVAYEKVSVLFELLLCETSLIYINI